MTRYWLTARTKSWGIAAQFCVSPASCAGLKLLLKNYRLSDDIAFRFSNRTWEQWPLTAEKFAQWVNQINGNGHSATCSWTMKRSASTNGPTPASSSFSATSRATSWSIRENKFLTPSQAIDRYEPAGEIDVPHMIQLVRHRAGSVRLARQRDAVQRAARALQARRPAQGARTTPQLLTDWRRLTSSDHFYYMCTKYWAEGDLHRSFSPYESPYDSYINFMNVLDNIQTRLREPAIGALD